MKAKIVVIEDEADLLELLEYHLTKEFDVEGFLSTKKVQEYLEEEGADLLIVDRNLPGVEGSDFVKELKSQGFDIPTIFLTAKTSQEDIEEGFIKGADDYITKPFNIAELILRVKAVLRRSKPQLLERITYKDMVLFPSNHELFIDEEPVPVTKLEFKLLMEFIKNRGQVLTRDYLLEHVWGDFKQEKSVNVAIKRLREKIDPQKNKNYIESIRGIGYRLC